MRSGEKDLCVIGSGIAGALVAEACAQRGLSVVMLEAGAAFDPTKRFEQHERLMVLGEPAWDWERPDRDAFTDSSTVVRYPLNSVRVKAVGGSTLHWASLAQRLPVSDFDRASRFGYGADWPVSYAELEPWYARAEIELGVSGDTPSAYAPRSTPFPMPAFPDAYSDRQWRDAAGRLGIQIAPASFAKNSVPYAGRPACAAFSTCNLCPVRAQYSADVHVARATASGRCALHTETVARRIVVDSAGRVTRVDATTLDGRDIEVRAARVVVACHSVESARLLLLSGIGNPAHLGRNLMEHWYTGARGRNTKGRAYPGRIGFHRLESMAFYDPPADQAPSGAVKLEFRADGDPLRELGRSDPVWGRALARFDRREFGRWLTVLAETEQVSNRRSRVTLDRERHDLFGDPIPHIHFELADQDRATLERGRKAATKLLEAAGAEDVETFRHRAATHQLGTCRMSARAEEGVVDRDLRVWGTQNLYLSGGSVFPTEGAVQPTLTIAALALRLADHLGHEAA